MNVRNYLIAGAAVLGMALPTLASAQTLARVTTDLNLRAGPGTGHPVVGTMPRGAQVSVYQCPGSWCQVGYGGTTGWAAQNYLSTNVAVQPQTRVYAVDPRPQVTFGIDVGSRYRHVTPRHRYGSRYDRRRNGRHDGRYDNRRHGSYGHDRYERGNGFSFSFGG